VDAIDAKVLSNRKPPYPPAGGLCDALRDSSGDVLLATNEQAREASGLFRLTEGIDIHPAAAVATASLINAAANQMISKNSLILLNITGGGEQRFKSERELYFLSPAFIIPVDPDTDEVREKLRGLI
jgi:cysteate synthase